ncbi:MAG TPA: NAD+ synthase [Tenuifilaceae bacterium]|nr:NAD+ synthase [Tenuifilaceae bacterium]HPE19268.1 NAD+ synthase [Tenuifilaceae bacterium]HPJ47142.1 NAD+ synthase [Tenuifilaceae bacterium]HPQ35119.1 NAD+ synthase [Tenuifilaceae bacterium]HRX68839.1 NAD+ synthase [Tenuifilaceae bacterium]
MKIALAQLNYIINNFEYNKSTIIDAIGKAKKMGAELVVFSELSVCGYPPHDLLDRKEFVENCLAAVNDIAKKCEGIAAVVGSPSYNDNPNGKMLFNSAFFLNKGKVESVHHKSLLPTYDIFDEYRYFEPCTEFNTVEFNGKRLAITVCEDLWDDQPASSGVSRNRLYTISPMEQLVKQNPDLVINIAASPFSVDTHQRRLTVFRGNVTRFGLPVINVNQVGGNTDLVFDGGSMVLNSEGNMVVKMKSFEEDFRVIDVDDEDLMKNPPYEEPLERIAQIHDALVIGIRDYFSKMGFKKATLGLSGGIDSAVTLALAQKALGSKDIRVLLLPSNYSSQHSVDDAIALAKNLSIQFDTVSIEDPFRSITNGLKDVFAGKPEDITEENIQARVRGTILMALSNKFGHLLLNTSNKSEAAVGYGTLYGDMNGAISVLGDVYKTDVFALARYINRNGEIIPENTITKPPSAELRPDQKDSDSLPDYDILDQILFRYIEGHRSEKEIIAEGYNPEVVKKVVRLVNINEYKRFQAPPILRVSSKAFGYGRKMPLVAKY